MSTEKSAIIETTIEKQPMKVSDIVISILLILIAVAGIYLYFTSKSPESIFKTRTAEFITDNQDCELGTKFYASSDGLIKKIRIFASQAESGIHVARIWELLPNSSPNCIFVDSTWNITSKTNSWQELTLANPIQIKENVEYIVAVSTCNKTYAFKHHEFDASRKHGHIKTSVGSGVYSYEMGKAPLNASSANTAYYRDIVFEATIKK